MQERLLIFGKDNNGFTKLVEDGLNRIEVQQVGITFAPENCISINGYVSFLSKHNKINKSEPCIFR